MDVRTLQNMLDRIADEFKTDDLASTDAGKASILNAVKDAVTYYQRESLFVNDMIDRSVQTIKGQDSYEVPSNLVAITEFNIIVRGQRYPLRDMEIQDILDYKTQVATLEQGQPYRYVFYNNDTGNGAVMLWPCPDQDGYVLEFVMQGRIPFPPTPTSANFWTTVGEEMVRNRAKWSINMGVFRNEADAQLDKALEKNAYEELLVESVQKQSTNTLKATRF